MLYAFGCNENNQLGIRVAEETIEKPTLVPLPENLDIVQLTSSGMHSAILGQNGCVYVTGLLPPLPQQPVFSLIEEFPTDVVHIASGWHFLLMVTRDGSVYGVGNNTHGQLGSVANKEPQPLSQLPVKLAQVAAGVRHAAGIDHKGVLWTWGNGRHKQLGHQHKSMAVASLSEPVKSVQCGHRHTVVLSVSGNVYVAGNGKDWEMIYAEANWISSGWFHVYIGLDSGEAVGWGRNNHQQTSCTAHGRVSCGAEHSVDSQRSWGLNEHSCCSELDLQAVCSWAGCSTTFITTSV